MRRLASLGLSLLMLGLIAVAIAAAAVPAITGTQAIIIDRNSMQEVLPQGSLAYIIKSPPYAPGDWVTYRHNGNVITHQIVGLAPNPANAALDGLWLQTKGTHNAEVDTYLINRDDIVGKVVYSIPAAGMALKVLGTLHVQIFIGLTALGLWLLSRKPKKPLPEMQTA